jgi:uncharacterized repeat protein (TIGR01451 family)
VISNGFGNPQTGEVSAVEAFNGYLYTGTYNAVDGAQILRSPEGVTWAAVTDPGFGISHDIAPFAILDLAVFNGRLYASTGRRNASQLWRSLNGVIWAPMDVTGFSDPDNVDVTALAEYGGKLYAGVTNQVTGAQIWSSYTGDNNTWTKVAPAVPETAPATVTGFAVFGGGLYAAVESEAPAQIWQSYGGPWATVVSDGFGDGNTLSTGGMAVFGGYLYVGAGNTVDGAQLWRTNDGTAWEQAITPGFGDPSNQTVEMVFVFQSQLYVGVQNTGTGIEIWRTTDGSAWEQANLDGFGDSNNSGTNWSNATAEFLGHFYVGTANAVDGGELWSTPGYAADLALSKVDALDPVFSGDAIQYTLTVSNAGPDAAQNVILTDTLPVGVNYVSATPDQGVCGEGAGVVTCSLDGLADGGIAAVIITVDTIGPGTFTNNASVTSDTPDPNGANNTDTEQTTVNPPGVVQADLSIAQVDTPDPVSAGAVLTYTLSITNDGPDPATTVVVTDSLPVQVTYGGASGVDWTCGHAGGEVVCTRANLDTGVASSIVITVTAPASGGVITNTAIVTSITADPNPANNTDTEQTTVNPPGVVQADLSIAQVDTPDPVSAGSVLTYTLSITNHGPDPATAVSVTDSLPVQVAYGGASGVGWNCSHVGGEVTCTRPWLGTGAASTIVITVTAPATSGAITNTAAVLAQEPDPDPRNNSAQATTRVNRVYGVYLPLVSR